MEWAVAILMHPDDEVGVLTKEGRFAGICAKSEDYVRAHADRILEAMVAVMKVPEHQSGLWVWKISHGWTQMRGENITNKGDKDAIHEL
jgi:hypothetical protein